MPPCTRRGDRDASLTWIFEPSLARTTASGWRWSLRPSVRRSTPPSSNGTTRPIGIAMRARPARVIVSRKIRMSMKPSPTSPCIVDAFVKSPDQAYIAGCHPRNSLCRNRAMPSHSSAEDFLRDRHSYNFCWPVRTLRQKDAQGHGYDRTPAMAAELADHVWSLREWLTFPAM